MTPPSRDEQAIAGLFLNRYLEDQRHGRSRSLLDYQADFPEYETVIAREFAQLHDASADERERRARDRIGSYRLLSCIGEGGMGRVYLAQQDPPLSRRVALKLLRTGMDSAEILARFEAERQALARMDHPGIARILDAGMAEDGEPWFALEHVAGTSLVKFCESRSLSLTERIELVCSVCDAVQHAHQKGVVHRDLKPSNILVTELDGKAIPKVIDFGVAKALHGRLTEDTLHTIHGRVIGTPAYMSPEQARSDGSDVDTRTDVYSLGSVLYHVITGTPPFNMERLRSASAAEIERTLTEDDPPLPSDRVAALPEAPHRRVELAGDLDVVTMKAMAKRRMDRYATPSELAADLRRFLRDEPVHARAPSITYELGKLVRRYRRTIAVAVILVVALVGALTSTAIAMQRAWEESDKATHAIEQFRWLSYGPMLASANARAHELVPPGPAVVADLEQWLADYVELGDKVDALSRALADVRSRGSHRDGEWTFAEGRDRALHDRMVELQRGLGRFEAVTLPAMRRRLAWSRVIVDRTVTERAQAWREAAAAVAGEPRYGGLKLEPQVGMVPLARDAATGLYEFALAADHEPSGGPRFVLLPGPASGAPAFFLSKLALSVHDLADPWSRDEAGDRRVWQRRLRRVGLMLPRADQWRRARDGGFGITSLAGSPPWSTVAATEPRRTVRAVRPVRRTVDLLGFDIGAQQLVNDSRSSGRRPVDVELRGTSGPEEAAIQIDASFVPVTGMIQIWFSQSPARLREYAANAGCRVTDIEPHRYDARVFTALLESNGGTSARTWHLWTGLTAGALRERLRVHRAYPIDVEAQRFRGRTRFAAIAVEFHVSEQRRWEWRTGTIAELRAAVERPRTRLLDFERLRTGRYHFVTIEDPTAPNRASVHTAVNADELLGLITGTGRKIVDLESFATPAGQRFDVVLDAQERWR